MSVLKGTAMWASVHTPNVKFEPAYTIDLVVDEQTYNEYASQGYPAKITDTGQHVLKFKRKQFKNDGTELPKPTVVDANTQPFTQEIGNGSIVNVQFIPGESQWGKKTFKKLYLVGVQVLEHVEYKGAGASEFTPVVGSASY